MNSIQKLNLVTLFLLFLIAFSMGKVARMNKDWLKNINYIGKVEIRKLLCFIKSA